MVVRVFAYVACLISLLVLGGDLVEKFPAYSFDVRAAVCALGCALILFAKFDN